jgi:dihydrofolate reductase
MISIIVAVSTNHFIGKDNQLLWTLPNDMKFFKNKTWALPVLMGRKTYESLGKPLNGRMNIIITNQTELHAQGATVVNSLEAAVKLATDANYEEIMVIGGGQIYREAIKIADRIYLTQIDAVLYGDTTFPEIDLQQWRMVQEESFPADEKHAFPYHFQTWERIKS